MMLESNAFLEILNGITLEGRNHLKKSKDYFEKNILIFVSIL